MKVLVTRPKQRAADICRMIEQAGGTALHFAAIEITEPDDSHSRDYARDNISDFELAIFISPTAVEKTLEFIPALPDTLRISAIGSKTVRALESQDQRVEIRPDGHNTEALLLHPALQAKQISGKKAVIFRGEGGRELLGDTLQSRGAEVFYANMYRRSLPSSADELKTLLQQADIITVSSNEGLQNLYDLAVDKNELTGCPVVVPGNRGQVLATALGFNHVVVADNATDEAYMNALEYIASKMSKKL